jgi:hypothetical protein
VFVYDWV